MKTCLAVNQKLSENSVTEWDFCDIQQTFPTGVVWFLPSLWRGVCQQQLERVQQLKSDWCQKTDKISFLEKKIKTQETARHPFILWWQAEKHIMTVQKPDTRTKQRQVQNQSSSTFKWRQHSNFWTGKTLKRNSDAHFHPTLWLLFDKDIRSISSMISISSKPQGPVTSSADGSGQLPQLTPGTKSGCKRPWRKV